MNSLEWLYNVLTVGIFVLFCVICSLVNKCCFAHGGGGGSGFGGGKCICGPSDFTGQITPSNNVIIDKPGEGPMKMSIYQYLQSNACDQFRSPSCDKCCGGDVCDTEDETQITVLYPKTGGSDSSDEIITRVTKEQQARGRQISIDDIDLAGAGFTDKDDCPYVCYEQNMNPDNDEDKCSESCPMYELGLDYPNGDSAVQASQRNKPTRAGNIDDGDDDANADADECFECDKPRINLPEEDSSVGASYKGKQAQGRNLDDDDDDDDDGYNCPDTCDGLVNFKDDSLQPKGSSVPSDDSNDSSKYCSLPSKPDSIRYICDLDPVCHRKQWQKVEPLEISNYSNPRSSDKSGNKVVVYRCEVSPNQKSSIKSASSSKRSTKTFSTTINDLHSEREEREREREKERKSGSSLSRARILLTREEYNCLQQLLDDETSSTTDRDTRYKKAEEIISRFLKKKQYSSSTNFIPNRLKDEYNNNTEDNNDKKYMSDEDTNVIIKRILNKLEKTTHTERESQIDKTYKNRNQSCTKEITPSKSIKENHSGSDLDILNMSSSTLTELSLFRKLKDSSISIDERLLSDTGDDTTVSIFCKTTHSSLSLTDDENLTDSDNYDSIENNNVYNFGEKFSSDYSNQDYLIPADLDYIEDIVEKVQKSLKSATKKKFYIRNKLSSLSVKEEHSPSFISYQQRTKSLTDTDRKLNRLEAMAHRKQQQLNEKVTVVSKQVNAANKKDTHISHVAEDNTSKKYSTEENYLQYHDSRDRTAHPQDVSWRPNVLMRENERNTSAVKYLLQQAKSSTSQKKKCRFSDQLSENFIDAKDCIDQQSTSSDEMEDALSHIEDEKYFSAKSSLVNNNDSFQNNLKNIKSYPKYKTVSLVNKYSEEKSDKICHCVKKYYKNNDLKIKDNLVESISSEALRRKFQEKTISSDELFTSKRKHQYQNKEIEIQRKYSSIPNIIKQFESSSRRFNKTLWDLDYNKRKINLSNNKKPAKKTEISDKAILKQFTSHFYGPVVERQDSISAESISSSKFSSILSNISNNSSIEISDDTIKTINENQLLVCGNVSKDSDEKKKGTKRSHHQISTLNTSFTESPEAKRMKKYSRSEDTDDKLEDIFSFGENVESNSISNLSDLKLSSSSNKTLSNNKSLSRSDKDKMLKVNLKLHLLKTRQRIISEASLKEKIKAKYSTINDESREDIVLNKNYRIPSHFQEYSDEYLSRCQMEKNESGKELPSIEDRKTRRHIYTNKRNEKICKLTRKLKSLSTIEYENLRKKILESDRADLSEPIAKMRRQKLNQERSEVTVSLEDSTYSISSIEEDVFADNKEKSVRKYKSCNPELKPKQRKSESERFLSYSSFLLNRLKKKFEDCSCCASSEKDKKKNNQKEKQTGKFVSFVDLNEDLSLDDRCTIISQRRNTESENYFSCTESEYGKKCLSDTSSDNKKKKKYYKKRDKIKSADKLTTLVYYSESKYNSSGKSSKDGVSSNNSNNIVWRCHSSCGKATDTDETPRSRRHVEGVEKVPTFLDDEEDELFSKETSSYDAPSIEPDEDQVKHTKQEDQSNSCSCPPNVCQKKLTSGSCELVGKYAKFGSKSSKPYSSGESTQKNELSSSGNTESDFTRKSSRKDTVSSQYSGKDGSDISNIPSGIKCQECAEKYVQMRKKEKQQSKKDTDRDIEFSTSDSKSRGRESSDSRSKEANSTLSYSKGTESSFSESKSDSEIRTPGKIQQPINPNARRFRIQPRSSTSSDNMKVHNLTSTVTVRGPVQIEEINNKSESSQPFLTLNVGSRPDTATSLGNSKPGSRGTGSGGTGSGGAGSGGAGSLQKLPNETTLEYIKRLRDSNIIPRPGCEVTIRLSTAALSTHPCADCEAEAADKSICINDLVAHYEKCVKDAKTDGKINRTKEKCLETLRRRQKKQKESNL